MENFKLQEFVKKITNVEKVLAKINDGALDIDRYNDKIQKLEDIKNLPGISQEITRLKNIVLSKIENLDTVPLDLSYITDGIYQVEQLMKKAQAYLDKKLAELKVAEERVSKAKEIFSTHSDIEVLDASLLQLREKGNKEAVAVVEGLMCDRQRSYENLSKAQDDVRHINYTIEDYKNNIRKYQEVIKLANNVYTSVKNLYEKGN